MPFAVFPTDARPYSCCRSCTRHVAPCLLGPAQRCCKVLGSHSREGDSSQPMVGRTESLFAATLAAAKRRATLLLLGQIVCTMGASYSVAQSETPFAIRVETPEVVVPVVVLDRTHRVATQTTYEELDEEITDLAAKDFHVLEDGLEQPIHNIAMELPHVRDVRDNISHHFEYSFTPRGVWASPDLWPQPDPGPTIHPLAVYLVSYDPPASSAGSCHRIQVKVSRRHATVYARDEYCNVQHPLSDPIGGTKLGRRMEDYAESEQGEFPVSVQVGSFFGNSDASRVDIAVGFPASAIRRKWVRVDLHAMVAVLGVVRDKDGTVVERFSDMASTLPWNFYRGPLPPDRDFLQKWEMAAIPARYETQIDLTPGDYDLQLVVTDGEKFGQIKMPIKVDNLHQDGLVVGDIFVCKRFHQVSEGAQAAARAPKYVPLVSNGMELIPAGNTRFSKTQWLVSYFEIYRHSPGPTDTASFRMRITDAKTGEVRMDSGWQTAEAEIRPKNQVIPITAQIAIDKLTPGAYQLDVQASDSSGGITPKRVTSFVIE
jgi:hypothetical protein